LRVVWRGPFMGGPPMTAKLPVGPTLLETAPWGFAIESLWATRTRKVRRNGLCAMCPCDIRIGQRIGLLAGRWSHVSCIIRANNERRSREASA
jgi:hypothetical protein